MIDHYLNELLKKRSDYYWALDAAQTDYLFHPDNVHLRNRVKYLTERLDQMDRLITLHRLNQMAG